MSAFYLKNTANRSQRVLTVTAGETVVAGDLLVSVANAATYSPLADNAVLYSAVATTGGAGRTSPGTVMGDDLKPGDTLRATAPAGTYAASMLGGYVGVSTAHTLDFDNVTNDLFGLISYDATANEALVSIVNSLLVPAGTEQ